MIDVARSQRGQTEPIAALVAITMVCLAISLYTGIHTDALSRLDSDRDASRATGDRVWTDVTDSGIVYEDLRISEAIRNDSLPQGYTVAVSITVVGRDGGNRTLARATFGPDGRMSDQPVSPPDRARRYERPVSVQRAPGTVRPGTLAVVVWE